MATIVTRSGKGSPLTHAEVDANFTNLNTDKLELSGGTMTGNLSFGDNDKAIFGAGSDLQIYHDGANSYIKDAGTGGLYLKANADFYVQSQGTDEVFIQAASNAFVKLFYNGSETLSTTSTGIDVTGTVTADGLTVDGNATLRSSTAPILTVHHDTNTSSNPKIILQRGANDTAGGDGYTDWQIEATGANYAISDLTSSVTSQRFTISSGGDISFYEDTGTTPKFFWDASAESLGIGTSSPSYKTEISDGTVTFGVNPLSAYSTAYVGTTSNHNMNFITNGSSRLNITSGGNVGIGTSSPTDKLNISSGSNQIGLDTGNQATYGTLDLGHFTNGAFIGTQAGTNAASNVLRFGTSGTERMRIDSSGNVGIGTSSPSATLDVSGAIRSTDRISGDGTEAAPAFRFTTDTNTGMFPPSGGDAIGFSTGGSEAMRIDSSGNLLVGTTDSAPGVADTNVGVALNSGRVFASAEADYALNLNRNTSDGDIVRFRKDGTTVGSIGVSSSALTIATGDTGLRFVDSADAISPYSNNTGSQTDGQTDLGRSSFRFKNLYLSGGVYLGGTGAANKLDDYEEGNWSPTIIGSVSNPTVTYGASTSGQYVKIGRVVMIKCDIEVDAISGGSGYAIINGVPFNSSGFPAWDSAVFRDADAVKINAQNYRVTGWVGNGLLYITYVGSSTSNAGDTSLLLSSLGTGRLQCTTWFTV